MPITSKKFEDLGYYTLRYNDHEVVYEQTVYGDSNPYFKRIDILLDDNSVTATRCYLTHTKWENTELTVEETDAISDLFEQYNNI